MEMTLSNWKRPEIHIDPVPFKEIDQSVSGCLRAGNKLSDTLALSCFKMKTTLGRKLPAEDFPAVKELVTRMSANDWLSAEDRQWFAENVPV